MIRIHAKCFLWIVPFLLTACSFVIASEPKPISPDHVIILGFDGWGASSFDSADMPFLKSIQSKSAWTLHKRSILPTSSACNWASMFKGAGPEAHGYTAWNTQTPAFDVTDVDEKGFFPSIFSIYREVYPEREMGYFYQWSGMKYVINISDFDYVMGYAISEDGSDKMRDAAVKYIKDFKPGLAAFIWDYPDKIGHTIGWYTEEYMQELTHIDSIIESIVKACDDAGILEKTLFVITSDHGGHDKTHGTTQMSDLETPFMIFGDRVFPGEINGPVMQYDVAAIIADYLYLDHPRAWRGKAPEGIWK